MGNRGSRSRTRSGSMVGREKGATKRKTWTYPENQHMFNYFDTEALPHNMEINRFGGIVFESYTGQPSGSGGD